MSTSTRFNSPSSSPLIPAGQLGPTTPQLLLDSQQAPLLTNHFLNQTSTTHEDETSLPCGSNATRNLLQRHIQEIKESNDTVIPRIFQLQQIRKSFKDFYTTTHSTVFQFLEAPLESNETLQSANRILKRFGRSDYNASRVRIRDLCLDISCNQALQDVNHSFSEGSIELWVEQARQILDSWKQTTTQLFAAEKRLQTQLATFQEIQKRSTLLLSLPINESYDTLVAGMEQYLKTAFQEHSLEEHYVEYIRILKRCMILTDAMNLLRLLVNSSTEPLCSICMTEPICMASVPCGHTFCQTCSQKQTISCYICRTPVKDKQRLFFS